MSKITAGKIMTRHDDDRRDLLREVLLPLRWRGYERGLYRVDLEPGLSIRLRLDDKDLAVVEQLDGLLDRIVLQNHAMMVEMVETEDYEELLAVAWFALHPVRLVGYGDGEYSIKIPGDFVVRFEVSPIEAKLLRRFDDLLARLEADNREAVDLALAEAPAGDLEAA